MYNIVGKHSQSTHHRHQKPNGMFPVVYPVGLDFILNNKRAKSSLYDVRISNRLDAMVVWKKKIKNGTYFNDRRPNPSHK